MVIDLTRSYNPQFYADNVLATIPLLPQHAWDKTSPTGKVGNYDETPSGAKAVWNFLQAQGRTWVTFATNPLWQVVDGPWKLAAFPEFRLLRLGAEQELLRAGQADPVEGDLDAVHRPTPPRWTRSAPARAWTSPGCR